MHFSFSVLFKKSLPNPRPPIFSSKYYPSNFIVLSFVYVCDLKYFTFFFIWYEVRVGISFFAYAYFILPAPFIEWLSLTLLEYFDTFKKSIGLF